MKLRVHTSAVETRKQLDKAMRTFLWYQSLAGEFLFGVVRINII